MRTSRLLPVILGMVLSCTVELAFAQAATVFSMTGTAQAVPNVGAPRTLRMGDSVNQGDTIATGAMSTAVLQFADGHVVAVVRDSRMTITSMCSTKAMRRKAKSSSTCRKAACAL